MPTGDEIIAKDFFYKSEVDGLYHKIGELKEDIMIKDEELLKGLNVETVRALDKNGLFEFGFEPTPQAANFIQDLFDELDRKIILHNEYTELFWIAELAKRYISEHIVEGGDAK